MMTTRQQAETKVFKRLITEIYQHGTISIVCDSFDFWYIINEASKTLKSDILARDGKVVFRPDSGDPVKILCGDQMALKDSPVNKGAVECLWDIFGGIKTAQGYKVLDPHVGLIYGDSITLERAEQILRKLKAKGFASSNVVFGVGSFTYNHCTRDTFGFAMKSTYGIVNGAGQEIFKDPITDSGVKKSAKGLLKVTWDGQVFRLVDQQADIERMPDDCLLEVFRNGKLVRETTIKKIREKIITGK